MERVSFSLDHLIVHVRDLEAATEEWRALGLEATDGGSHPIGTRNSIVRFPDATFLELLTIADRERVREKAPRMLAFAELHPDGPMHWALRTDDLAAARRALEEAGVKLGPTYDGEGRRSSGKVARWRSCQIEEPAFPFLVEYAGPPTSAPSERGVPARGLAAAIVQGVNGPALADRLARAFGPLRADGRIQLDRGEIVVVEEPNQHPGVIGAELLVDDAARATAFLSQRAVRVVDGWVSDGRLHGLALRLVAEG